MQELSELVYVLCTKSRSVLCIPMGIHRNGIRTFAANLNLKEHFFILTMYIIAEREMTQIFALNRVPFFEVQKYTPLSLL